MGKLKVLGVIIVLAVFFHNCTGYRSISSLNLSSLNFPSPASLVPGLFKIERKTVMVLPYDVRLSKLKNLIGSPDAALYAKLEAQKVALGSFDFSKGIAPDLTFSDSKLTAWTLALQPYCASPTLAQKFPFPQSAQAFMQAAYGRNSNTTDQAVIDGVQSSMTGTAQQKLEVFCYIVLSSLEFVAR